MTGVNIKQNIHGYFVISNLKKIPNLKILSFTVFNTDLYYEAIF